MSRLQQLFEKHDNEYLKFDGIVEKRNNRPDIHAFLMLDEIQPSKNGLDMVSAAEHDEIFLSIDVDGLFLTEEQVIELLRCGVRYDEEYDCFAMFV